MDVLDNLISLAQISGSVDVQCRFQGEWSVSHERKLAHGLAHIVTQGSGYLKVDHIDKPLLIHRGDIVFFPRAAAHLLTSDSQGRVCSQTPNITKNDIFTLKQIGSSSVPDLSLFCTRFSYDPQAELMQNLPEFIHIKMDPSLLFPILSLLNNEVQQTQLGAVNMINSLASVLLTLIIRTYLAQQNVELSGALRGWTDKRLRVVIQEILEQPEQNWSLEKMANLANLSAVQLIRVFKQQLNETPYAFVHKIRLQKGALYLKRSSESVLSIALSTGFQSETHFGKAFKKYYGMTPGQYRKVGYI